MNNYGKFNFDDPIGMYRRYSPSQYFTGLEPLVLGSLIGAGSDIAGGLIASAGADKGGKTTISKISTFSKRQKAVNALLYDFLMGIRRDEKGRELGRSPLLRKFANKKPPQQRVAPFSDAQKDILSQVKGIASGVKTRKGPDKVRQQQLARGILPGDKRFETPPRFLKHGGKVEPGEKAFVGEGGIEMIEALPGGGVEVIPNPNTVSSPQNIATAMAESKEIEKLTGVRALQTGTKRYLEDPTTGTKTYLDYDYGGKYGELFDQPGSAVQTGFEESLASDYSTARGADLTSRLFDEGGRVGYKKAKKFGSEDLLGEITTREAAGASKSDIKDWLTEQYNIEGADFGSGAFSLPDDKLLGGEWGWYENLQSKYGGDITQVPIQLNKAGIRLKADEDRLVPATGSQRGGDFIAEHTIPGEQPGYNVIQENYLGGLQDYWSTLPTATGNDNLDAAIGGMPEDIKAGFGQWIAKNVPQSADLTVNNPWTQIDGKWTFTDPFDVDTGNVAQWASDYIASEGYEANPDFDSGATAADPTVNNVDPYIKTDVETPAVVDYTPLVDSLAGPEGMTDDVMSAVNAHLANWKGGVLSGIEMNYNITSGKYEFGQMYGDEWEPASTNIEAALTQAVGDYTAGDIAGGPDDGDPGGIAGTDAGIGDGTGLLDQAGSILSGIAKAEFDVEKSNELFDAGVAVPANKRFSEYTVPAIESALGGHAIRSSAREKYIEQGGKDLNEYLTSQHAIWTRDAENTFENRRLEAINSTMTLATLPTAIGNAKLSGEATRAMIARTYNDMDIANTILDMDMTNNDLSVLLSSWSLLSTEQMLEDKEFMAKYNNLLRGSDVLPLDELINLMMGFNAESTEAIITGTT